MKYEIQVKKSVYKALNKIPHNDQIKISKDIKSLSNNPRPSKSIKLKNSDYYRIRCGIYRVIYEIKDNQLVIIILKVDHRKDVYN